jgi:hypothetical protein
VYSRDGDTLAAANLATYRAAEHSRKIEQAKRSAGCPADEELHASAAVALGQ